MTRLVSSTAARSRVGASIALCSALAAALIGCSEEVGNTGSGAPGPTGTGAGSGTGGGGGEGGIDLSQSGTPLTVTVPAEGRVYITVDPPAVVTPATPEDSDEWDLAFEGIDVLTNSGVSGTGHAGGFGPLSAPTFLSDTTPEVPFITQDETGGAFLRWYDYDGETHAIWSRYHVHAVRAEGRLFKVQVLSYYGEIEGAPVSAVYSLRYAEVTDAGAGETVELEGIDASAGGATAPPEAPSACLNLVTGALTALTPDEARESTSWHLCLRRDVISVNGELGGPGNTSAVDFDGDKTKAETEDEVQARTASSELPHFDEVGFTQLDDPTVVYRGDRVITAFSDLWIEPGSAPLEPTLAAWLAITHTGNESTLVAFLSFTDPTATSPGTIDMRIKPVK
ncbi:MAG: HmuY family protein [Polyangiaceae bacterium]